MWESTLAGLTIPGPCRTNQFGQSSRTCSVMGVWEPIDYTDCYDLGCAEDGEWNSAPVRTMLMRRCPSGYKGYQYRFCSESGQWAEADMTECGKSNTSMMMMMMMMMMINDLCIERIYCPAVSGFDETPSGVTVNVFCGEHYYGNMTAICSNTGAWTNVDVSQCVEIPTCEEDGLWPRTNIDTVREMSCGAGIQGMKTRPCYADGTWGPANESQCGRSLERWIYYYHYHYYYPHHPHHPHHGHGQCL